MGIRMSGLISGLDTESIVGALMSAQSLKKTKMTNAKTKLEWKQTKWKDLNSKLYKLYTGSVSKMRLSSTFNAKKAAVANADVASVSANSSAVNGSYNMTVKQIATSQYVTSGKVESLTDAGQKLSSVDASLVGKKVYVNGDTENPIEITEDMSVTQFTKTLAAKGINASYDTTQQRFFLSSKSSGEESAFTLTSDDGALAKLGLSEITRDAEGKIDVSGAVYDEETKSYKDSATGMTIIKAQDSEVVLNGAMLTSASATLVANGLSISLTSTGSTSFTVATDVDGIYDSIKAALKEYNDVLAEMNTLYSAESAKDYEPLTSEQKKAMSDDEVEEWENKIKSALLRNDTTLDGIREAMKSAMQSSVSYNGQSYTLGSLGIMTSTNWQEGGLYHIYGDSEDSTYADQADKLKAAIASDPQLVSDVLSGIFENLRTNMYNKMGTTELSSALTFYNDKQMDTQLKNYQTEISDYETKLEDLEDTYYKKFSALESAMAKMQSQQSSLSSLIGG